VAAGGRTVARVVVGVWAGSCLPRGLARPSNVSRALADTWGRRVSRGVWNRGVQSKETRRDQLFAATPSTPAPASLAAAWHVQQRVSDSARYRESLHPRPAQTPADDAR
jgi:hypothetical protein